MSNDLFRQVYMINHYEMVSKKMDIKLLETFLWINRLGGFGAAANHLNTTQPAISRRISRLEKTLGVKLFQGNTRNRNLTRSGRDLIEHATKAVDLVADIQQEIGQQNRVAGLLRLGVVDTIALTCLPDLVARIRKTYPRLRLELLVDLTVNLKTSLKNGELDVAILLGPVASNQLVGRKLGKVQIGWMASPIMDIPDGILTPAEMAKYPVVSHTKGTDHYHIMRNWFTNSGATPPLFNGCSSLSTLIQLTASGIGISVLPLVLTQRDVLENRLRIIKTNPSVAKNLFEVVRPNESTQPFDLNIIDLILECISGHQIFQVFDS